jgi:hypothetical protein
MQRWLLVISTATYIGGIGGITMHFETELWKLLKLHSRQTKGCNFINNET